MRGEKYVKCENVGKKGNKLKKTHKFPFPAKSNAV